MTEESPKTLEQAESSKTLEQAADQAQARLLDTVVRLEQRGRGAVEIPAQAARSARRFSLPLAGFAVVGITALVVYGVGFRKSHRARDRWHLIKTFWRHPDRGLRAERRPLAIEITRSLLLTLATSALAIPIRHAVRVLADRAMPPKADADASG